jgi:ribosomal protein S18 acetylase RimI-like enzyme
MNFIRKATTGDAELLAQLGAVTFTEAFGAVNTQEDLESYLQTAFSITQIHSEIAEPGNVFFILYQHNEAIAYAKLNSNEKLNSLEGKKIMQIQRIYARRKALGTGAGAQLMQQCIDEAQSHGVEVLWLTVWQQNLRAIEFYKKWGFEVIGEKQFMVGRKQYLDHVMKLDLKKSAVP